MDEPTVVTVEPTEPVVAPVTPVETPTNYFGTDGALTEGWNSTLSEDIREEKSLASFKTVGDLAKSFVNTKKMVGKNVVAIPNETSTEGEWQEYFKAGGRPETVDDYGLKAPEGLPPELAEQIFPEAKLKSWQDRFFKAGVSKKAADVFVAEFAKDILAESQAITQANETAAAELVSGLATEWGAAYDQKLHMGDMAVQDFAGDNQELKESLGYLRKDPNAIKMLAHFGGLLAEGKPPNYAAIPTPSDYGDQIDTLKANPLYVNGTQKERMKIANKMMELRKLQKPEPVNT